MHQGDSAMIKQVESPQIQHSATRISSRRGRDVARQPQHTILQISCTSLDMVVARLRYEKRARPDNETNTPKPVRRQEQLEMSRSDLHKTFNKASRWGHSRAATARGAGRARCGLREHGRQQEQAPPDMLTGQSIRACLRREVPTDHELCIGVGSLSRQRAIVTSAEIDIIARR